MGLLRSLALAGAYLFANRAHAWLQNRNSEAELRSFLFSINDTYQKDIEDHNPSQKDRRRY
jgi:hypothetical protein